MLSFKNIGILFFSCIDRVQTVYCIRFGIWYDVFFEGPSMFKRRNHIRLEIIPAKAKSLLISLCHFDLFKNFGSFLEAQSSSGLESLGGC